MGFLKSFAVLPIFIVACNSKVTPQPKTEETTTATAAIQTQSAPKTLPSFALLDAAGNAQNLQSLKGKKVLVNLWATWCPPCRAEMPSLAKLYSALDKDKTSFVFISLDKDFEIAKKYVQANGLNLPVYFPAGDVPDLFLVEGIPATFIFDEQGQLIAQREGSENYNTPSYRKLFGATR